MLDIIAHMQRQFGGEVIRPLSGIDSVTSIDTGLSGLDRALATGGLPCGFVTAMVGTATSGATTVTQIISANIQQSGRTSVWVDATASLDPDYAARCGFRSEDGLVLRPSDLTQAYQMADDLLANTPPALLLLVSPERLPARLIPRLRATDCALLHLAPNPVGGDLVLMFERADWLYDGADIRGFTSRVQVTRSRFAPAEQGTTLTISFDGLIDGDAT